MRLRFITSVVGLVNLCLPPTPVAAADNARPPVYNRDIRPILSDRCFACHGRDSLARQADLRLDIQERAHELVIVPGDAAASELIARVTSERSRGIETRNY
jgi:hypothetical protein